ncbi:MAG: MFS transporter [Chitinophagaceae bacterium]|nr:MFS transporter [Chitinophagaceae bacterium]MBL0336313.1 MFS transporter [Chitinophagaceae bacterium]
MRIITRTILLLSLISLLADIASELLYPVIPVYLDSIGFSALWIGVLEGVANFTAGISKGYFGKWSDRTGLRLPFVKLGYLMSAVSKPLIGFFVYPIWIFFARSLDRLGKGVRTAARDAILSSQSTKETKARVFGFHRGMDTLGATIGPAIALLILLWHPGQYKTIFMLAFIPGLLSVALIFLLKEKKQPVSTLGKGNFFSFFKYWRIASPGFKKLVAGLLVFAFFNSSDIFLLLKTREATAGFSYPFLGKTLSSETITVAAYVFYNLVYALASYPLGAMADRFGFKTVFAGGLVVFAGVYAGFAFQPSIGMIFLLYFFYGLYAAATEGVVKAWITNFAHEKDTATAVGFYTSCESICTLAASVIAGLLWTSAGSLYTFLIPSLVAAFTAIYFFIYIRNKA